MLGCPAVRFKLTPLWQSDVVIIPTEHAAAACSVAPPNCRARCWFGAFCGAHTSNPFALPVADVLSDIVYFKRSLPPGAVLLPIRLMAYTTSEVSGLCHDHSRPAQPKTCRSLLCRP